MPKLLRLLKISLFSALFLSCSSYYLASYYEDDGIYLINSYIPTYNEAINFGHDSRRKRKVLLRQKEITKLSNDVARKGMTLVPLSLYFNKRGLAKLKIGLAKGRTGIDKRNVIKDRDWKRDKARILKDKG